MLTKKQAALFWRSLAAAADRQAVPDREAYRKRVLREELGVEHLRDVDRTEGFDRLMLRLAQDAEDWHGLAYYSVAGERRLADLVADCATQVLELTVADRGLSVRDPADSLNYISGILLYHIDVLNLWILCENSSHSTVASTDDKHILYIWMNSHRHMNNHLVIDKLICI